MPRSARVGESGEAAGEASGEVLSIMMRSCARRCAWFGSGLVRDEDSVPFWAAAEILSRWSSVAGSMGRQNYKIYQSRIYPHQNPPKSKVGGFKSKMQNLPGRRPGRMHERGDLNLPVLVIGMFPSRMVVVRPPHPPPLNGRARRLGGAALATDHEGECGGAPAAQPAALRPDEARTIIAALVLVRPDLWRVDVGSGRQVVQAHEGQMGWLERQECCAC